MTNEQMTNAPLTPAEIAEAERLVTQILDWGLVRTPWAEVLRAFGFLPRALSQLQAQAVELADARRVVNVFNALAQASDDEITAAELRGARAALEAAAKRMRTVVDWQQADSEIMEHWLRALAASDKRLAALLADEERKP